MSFTNYEELGQLALDFQPGVLSMQRGEEGPTDATTSSDTDGQCFHELPVNIKIREGNKRMYIKTVNRILTTIPTVVVCNDLLPVKFFLDEYSAIC